jgi:adenine-specific DNA-methyltransferase
MPKPKGKHLPARPPKPPAPRRAAVRRIPLKTPRVSKPKKTPPVREAANYAHPEADLPLRPEVGTQAQFRKHKPAQRYRFDSSLSPALEWDGQNSAREQGEALVRQILDAGSLPDAKAAAAKLKALAKPFLNWSGKAERLSFDTPTLPLFVHERLSTQAIITTLTGHKKDKQMSMFDLFSDPQRSVTEQVLKAYEHRDQWVNRMVLGDALVVMNSLLHYEGMGGQVQTIYIDPPYGVKFGSNFQPFVRKRDVSHGDDEDMTREPEMVQAYRDTWEVGLHSYLTYLRDRLLLARDLLAPSGSVFVQISDENLHHVRELMDEVFGANNFCGLIAFRTTGGQATELISSVCDYLLWYAKDKERVKYRQLYQDKVGPNEVGRYRWVESPDAKTLRELSEAELENPGLIPDGWRLLVHDNLTSQGISGDSSKPFVWKGTTYNLPANSHWKTTPAGMEELAKKNRLMAIGSTLRFKRYLEDFPVSPFDAVWEDTAISGFGRKKQYVVETNTKVVARCLLMTTDPGDLVLDPTCGSGTTAYVAEQWGRRWITCDVSRVPLALARQRLLTATFPWFKLKDESRGPSGGFIYERRQNAKGEEVGGIVPHVTLKSIANNEKPGEEVLVDRPEELKSITRVTGPFVVEASIPTALDGNENAATAVATGATEPPASFAARLLEVLRKSPVLRLDGNRTVTLRNIRPPAKSLTLSAEAMVDKPSLANLADDAAKQPGLERDSLPVVFVFGPENGAVSEKLVYEAAREAHAKSYTHLYVIGFAIQPNARELVEKSADVMGLPATYVQATPDLLMGDLLKNMRSSQIFSVCGLPEVKVRPVAAPAHAKKSGESPAPHFQAELLGLDVFDPVTMAVDHRHGNDVPAWLLDTDYNGRCFHVSQAFFPRTSAWENLKKSLKGEYDEAVWDHLAGNLSAPFTAGEHRQIAVKVIDDRGNELLVVKPLPEAKG